MPVEPSDGWADGGDADDQDWPGGVIWPAETDQDIPGRASGEMPGGGPGGGQASQMLVMGTVTAVSATSITIGGNGPSVTAAVTGSTRVTGRVGSIGGIKVGDQVSAQLTQSGGRVVATAIQYPAQQGGGGRMP